MSECDHPASGEFVLHDVSPESPLFEQVVALADANRAFLGIMSHVAWRDYAARGGLIAATANTTGGGESVVGLVSFRRGRQRAALAHLAVAEDVRNRGLARLLVSEVSSRTQDLSGVLVRCRRDFPARKIWPRLDFVPRGEQPGRGKEPHIITWWWLDHGHPDLFAVDAAFEAGVPVVLDANVFIDLHNDGEDPDAALTQSALDEAQESGALLMVTPELARELDRYPEAAERKRLIQRAQAAPLVHAPRGALEAARAVIRSEAEFAPGRAQDESDAAHLAYASAAGAGYLVTRDVRAQRRLGRAAATLGVKILSPLELAAELASDDDSARYWPAVAHGQSFEVIDDLGPALSMLKRLNAEYAGEKRRALERRLEPLLLAGARSQAWALSDSGGTPLAGLALTRAGTEVTVHLARVAPGPLQDVLARYIVQFLGNAGAMDGHAVVRVVDPHLPPTVHDSLASEGFERARDVYIAPRLHGLLSVANTAQALREVTGDEPSELKVLRRIQEVSRDGGSAAELLALEAALAPLTLAEQSIPTWSVPIRPHYAWELLGVGESLFPRKDSLGISVEHVYYTGAPALPPAGSRVLWYSSGENTPAYIAQSVVLDSGRASWKDAFRSHRRLGIYTREEVRRAAAPSGKVGYIRFGRSRPLPRAVPLDRVNVAASDLGTKMMLRGPWQLPAGLATELMEVAFEFKR